MLGTELTETCRADSLMRPETAPPTTAASGCGTAHRSDPSATARALRDQALAINAEQLGLAPTLPCRRPRQRCSPRLSAFDPPATL
jgi:hypothetical protein